MDTKLAGKVLEKAKRAYWADFTNYVEKKSHKHLFCNTKKGAGGWHSLNVYKIQGIRLELRVNINERRLGCGLHIETKDNKEIFKRLLALRKKIEESFYLPGVFNWSDVNRKSSTIKMFWNVDVLDPENREKSFLWLYQAAILFDQVADQYIFRNLLINEWRS